MSATKSWKNKVFIFLYALAEILVGISALRIFSLTEAMRKKVQDIFLKTNFKKQVLMFTATLNEKITKIAKKFMKEKAAEIIINEEKNLTLHGLKQYYVNVSEQMKNKTLFNLLHKITYNQVIIFTSKVKRAKYLNQILNKMEFESISIYGMMPQKKRIEQYKLFKDGKKRILVTTNLISRGIDIERVNLVINYDIPESSDTYLHRVGRAGRYNTKGISFTFVTGEEDMKILKEIQDRFVVKIEELPKSIDEAKLTA